MKKLNIQLLLIETAFLLFALVDSFILSKNLLSTYIYYIKPVVWWGLGLFLYFNLNKNKTIVNKSDKFSYVFIFIMLSTALYYCSGLLFGFLSSAYNHNFLSILRNLFCFVSILIPYELIRATFINKGNSKADFICTVVFMSLIVIDMQDLLARLTSTLQISYLLGKTLPTIITQLFLCFIMKNCGLRCAILWQVFPATLLLIMPVVPNLDWFYTLLYTVASCLVCYVFVYYTYSNKEIAHDVKVGRKRKPYSGIISMIVIFLLVGFVSGMFGVKPTVIASNSMNTYFYKGDIVVIDKNGHYDINTVIQYQHQDIKVIHRIVEKQTDETGETFYITKGDNNNDVDSWKVYDSQIDGTVCMVIPKIGYIALWVNQAVGGLL